MKKSTNDILVIGLALFAMFFGAGNLIFPPYLGKMVGSEFIIATTGFIITGVGIPFLAILSCTKTNGNFEDMALKIGKYFPIVYSVAIFLAVGPMLAIPRTAATTYEVTLKPVFPWMSSFVSMVLYFALNLLFVLRPSKVIDAIGKFLTPALLITLLIIIIKAIVFPIGDIINTNATSIFSNSLIEGYQTMDALAGLIFAAVITSSVLDKGYKGKAAMNITIKSGLVAISALAFIYGGLMYIGAQTNSILPKDISKTSLLLEISNRTLGSSGKIIMGIAMGLACFTTSVGLITAGASFFNKITKSKLPYRFNAILISLTSIVIGSFGVDKIVKISVPILYILYPVAITLILGTLVNSCNFVLKVSVYTSLVFSILDTLPMIGVNINFIKSTFSMIPFTNLGFVWIVPTIFTAVISLVCKKFLNKNNESNSVTSAA
ncbi:branched-chain amino acid transport system carrier protein [Clostridium polyendosporum]|uniref:Branched-chain amino acid transport system carrier protein n=1 Tax=Clostridium polyendosporum TaxID=69208 RepID=A0A919RYH6_9CLOT|nr:branched-chain amino acid transport system II carrier protein [Clostridium polyendosporum]GIM27338.1 branched-chain amino acid transport system carrier protein [Clostridium polyendosporum]